MSQPQGELSELPASASAPAYRFLIRLKEDEDSIGLARLLEDVMMPEAKVQASFEALDTDAIGVQDSADGPVRVFVLEDDASIVPPTDMRSVVLLGVNDEASLKRPENGASVVAFTVSGPIDFAAEVMERFSGDDAPVELFEVEEAVRMRALAADFPLEEDGTPPVASDLVGSGYAHWRNGELDQALRAFDAALEDEPDRAELHLWQGYLLRTIAMRESEEGREPRASEERARQECRLALALNYPIADEIGEVLLDLRDYAGAAKAYRAALQIEETAALRTSLGTAMALDEALEDRFGLACKEYDAAIALDPDNAAALRSRAVVRLELCDYQNSLIDSKAAEEQGATDARLYFYRALCLRALGDLAEARRCAARARETATEADGLPMHEYEHVYALVMIDLGRLEEALSVLDSAYRLALEDDRALSSVKASRALALARLGELDKGRAACEESLALLPDAPEPYATLAWICERQDQLIDARVAIERAIHLMEGSPRWENDCQLRATRWRLYLIKAGILNAVAERYDDRQAAEVAVEASVEAQAYCDNCKASREETALAQLFLERARSHALCQRHELAAVALRECLRVAPQRSAAWYVATSGIRHTPGRSLEIKARWIVLLELVALAGVIALFLDHRLSSGAFAALIVSLPALGLAAFSLPVITELRIGAVQLQKVVATANAMPLPQLETPAPPAQPLQKSLRSNMTRIARDYFPGYFDPNYLEQWQSNS